MTGAVPGALVLRLFLTPDEIGDVGIIGQDGAHFLFREGVELLDPYQGHVLLLRLATGIEQVVVDLAGAEDHALDAFGIQRIDFADGVLEGALCQLFELAHRQRVAQQGFGRHHDERTAHGAHYLTTQHMEHLRRGGGHAHLHVVLGAHLQVTLQTGGRVLRALTLVTVGQQHGQAAHPAPLLLAGGEELIHHHLGAVGEVAELGFPDGQTGRLGAGVAIFERQYRVLGQHRVVDLERTLLVVQVAQRGVGARIGLVVQHGVAMEEGATAGVFPGEADARALVHQGGVGQGLGKAPVHQLLAGGHQAAVFVNLLDLALQHMGRRVLADALAEGLEVIHGHSAVVAHGPVVAQIRGPVHGVQLHGTPLLAHPLAPIQGIAIVVD